MAQAQLGKSEQAFMTMQRAIAAGLPFERFVAGPRDLLAPLAATKEFQDYLAAHPVKLIHGPMLGDMTGNSVRVWVRTADESEVRVNVFPLRRNANDAVPIQSAIGRTTKSMDYTGVISITSLEPATEYQYDVLIDGKPALEGGRLSFRTFPRPASPVNVQVAFGGCAAYVPENERMWDTIAARHPLAMLLLGDNVYIDLPQEAGPLHRYTYYQRQSRPEFRRLTQATPVFSIWDDHDAAVDDVWLGPYRDKPRWKPSMLQLYKENWNNPGYGNPQWPGCWFRFALGPVDFFMLDCRYYRTNPFGDDRTILGPVQKAWLKNGLMESKADFKVIVSSVSWSSAAKPGSRDTWDGFPEEREEIFSWIEQHRIEGVVLLSGDRHRSEAWQIPRPHGYPLYDMLSSRLTNAEFHELVPGALFGYNEKCSFGLLTFDATRDDPQLRYDIINIDGDTVHSLTINRSQLQFPGTARIP
jgi:alkaline phosphatase D